MKRAVLPGTIAFVVFLPLLTAASLISRVDAQDTSEERISALETRVAAIETAIASGTTSLTGTVMAATPAPSITEEQGAPGPVGGNGLALLPPGEPGALSVVAVGTYHRGEIGLMLPVVVRNNTDEAVYLVSVSAAARGPDGALLASGRDRTLLPAFVAPGGVAFGYVDFEGAELPVDTSFELTVDGRPAAEFHELGVLDFVILSATRVDDRIVGEVENATTKPIGMASVNVICLDETGAVLRLAGAAVDRDPVPPGERGTFQVALRDPQCPYFLVAATGFGT